MDITKLKYDLLGINGAMRDYTLSKLMARGSITPTQYEELMAIPDTRIPPLIHIRGAYK